MLIGSSCCPPCLQVWVMCSTAYAYRQHSGNVYGLGSEGVLKPIAQFLFVNNVDKYNRAAQAAKSFQLILETTQARLDGIRRERAAVGSFRFERLTHLFSERSRLYSTARLDGRLKIFVKLIREDGYEDQLGFGLEVAYWKDFMYWRTNRVLCYGAHPIANLFFDLFGPFQRDSESLLSITEA